jgi:hypothetical protein
MNMRSTRAPSFVLAAALTLSACSKPQPPTVTPKSVQVLGVGPGGVQLVVVLDVTNPNSFPLYVRAVDGRLLLGAGAGAEVGKAHAELSSSIPAHGTSSVTSELAATWTDLAALGPFVMSAAPVPYRFEGSATIGGDSLSLTLPFTLTGELTRAQLIRAGLSKFSLPGLR